jgi:predicted Zn-dependent protease with MMP-like domain
LKDVQIKNIIDRILLQSGSRVKVELESYFPGDRFAGGKYNLGSHTITLYIEEIKAQCKQIFSSLDRFEEYLQIVLAHEIGHAEDIQLLDLIDEMDMCSSEYTRRMIALKIEENAWDYARKLIPENIHSFLDTIVNYSLEPYRESLKTNQESLEASA